MKIVLGNLSIFLNLLLKFEEESAGLLIGSTKDDIIYPIIAMPVENVLKSRVEFLANPYDMVVGHMVAENYKLSVVSLYHTHPYGMPIPSNKDINGMKMWPIPWIIISRKGIRAWILKEDDKPIELELS